MRAAGTRFTAIFAIVSTLLLSMVSCSISHENRQPAITCSRVYSDDPISRTDVEVDPLSIEDTGCPAGVTGSSETPELIEITVSDAVMMALEHNRELIIERLNPEIMQTFVEQGRSEFEPVLTGSIASEKNRSGEPGQTESRTDNGAIRLRETLPFGTTLEAGMEIDREDTDPSGYTVGTSLTATQPLLQGAGLSANLATIRKAGIDETISEFELRGFTETLVSEVEDLYWDYVLASLQVGIVEESLKLVEQEMDETRQRILVGSMAETELVAVEAEHALQQESLINARGDVEILQVKLLRMINPDLNVKTGCKVITRSDPAVPPSPVGPLEDHIRTALTLRPDLNQAQLALRKGDIELVMTRNGLLPRLDLFARLGRTGYAESFRESIQGGDDGARSLEIGVSFDVSLLNRDSRALHRRSALNRKQLQTSLENMKDLVRQDVKLACINVTRTRQQVDATAGTRRLQQEKLRVETARFHAGKTTGYFVAQAHRDLLVSEVAEVRALINYIKACNRLYLVEGSLLLHRGLSVEPDRVPAAD